MNNNTILTLVLIALVAITAVQAVQLNSLKNKLTENELSASTSRANSKASAPSVPSSMQDLPQMVGGC